MSRRPLNSNSGLESEKMWLICALALLLAYPLTEWRILKYHDASEARGLSISILGDLNPPNQTRSNSLKSFHQLEIEHSVFGHVVRELPICYHHLGPKRPKTMTPPYV